MSASDASTTLSGFTTPRVDTQDPVYQADPNFKPDKAALYKADESHDGWVHAHNSVRYEIGELKRALEAIDGKALVQWQVDAVKAWWAGHEVHIHEHHSNEDDILNPILRTRIVYPEKLEADHVQLVAAMDAIAKCIGALQAGATVAELRGLWAHYEAIMLPHLHEEEQVGLPLARAFFTPAEIDKIVGQILKRSDPVSLGSFVHVIGHKKETKAFMKENGIPGFVWHIPGSGFKALRTLYRNKMQKHIDSLLAGEPVASKTKKQLKENAAKAAKAHAGEGLSAQCALSPCKRVNVLSVAHPRAF